MSAQSLYYDSYRERLWNAFANMKFKEYYFRCYEARAKRRNNLVTAICLLATSASIAAWSIWGEHPTLWAAAIAVAQVVQTLKPIFSSSSQLGAIKHFYPQASALMVEMEHDFLKADIKPQNDETAKEIAELIYRYEKEYNLIEQRYFSGVHLPDSKRLIKKAEADRRSFFKVKYGIGDEADGCVWQKCPIRKWFARREVNEGGSTTIIDRD